MLIVRSFPPNYAKIEAALNPPKGAIFCYGDTIYNPHGEMIHEALRDHEEVHSNQQRGDIEGWRDRYIADPVFRLEQEIPAHQKEYAYFFNGTASRNKRRLILRVLARRLSGKFYGNIVSFEKAKSLIKNKRKNEE